MHGMYLVTTCLIEYPSTNTSIAHEKTFPDVELVMEVPQNYYTGFKLCNIKFQ